MGLSALRERERGVGEREGEIPPTGTVLPPWNSSSCIYFTAQHVLQQIVLDRLGDLMQKNVTIHVCGSFRPSQRELQQGQTGDLKRVKSTRRKFVPQGQTGYRQSRTLLLAGLPELRPSIRIMPMTAYLMSVLPVHRHALVDHWPIIRDNIEQQMAYNKRFQQLSINCKSND